MTVMHESEKWLNSGTEPKNKDTKAEYARIKNDTSCLLFQSTYPNCG